ncbi:MAG: class I SAM-dependent DNA methyltransferase [Armatimonadota bacterium]
MDTENEVRPARQFTLIAPYYDILMGGVPYRQWVDYVEELLADLGLRPRLVLDLACGTGMVAQELAARGYDAMGADVSEAMVRQARRRTEVPVCAMDACRLGFRPAFDLVVCLFDSLNYIVHPQELEAAFRGVYECLLPGGALIFDLNTPRALERNLFTQHNLGRQARLTYDWHSSYDKESRICTVDMRFVWRDGGEVKRFREIHRQRAHTTREVRAALERVGFERIQVYGYLSHKRPNRWTTRAYYVALKPRT